VKIGGHSMVGGDMLEHPGDPGGAPENVINCYCRLDPVVDKNDE